eukprot:GEMP01062363.1.p1 GENE.GEMP01062363.1~~GEMP01062363.1.p1  ORF type:complete len:211 (+),score=37.15 GEMP01062363.1:257-889(+)
MLAIFSHVECNEDLVSFFKAADALNVSYTCSSAYYYGLSRQQDFWHRYLVEQDYAVLAACQSFELCKLNRLNDKLVVASLVKNKYHVFRSISQKIRKERLLVPKGPPSRIAHLLRHAAEAHRPILSKAVECLQNVDRHEEALHLVERASVTRETLQDAGILPLLIAVKNGKRSTEEPEAKRLCREKAGAIYDRWNRVLKEMQVKKTKLLR